MWILLPFDYSVFIGSIKAFVFLFIVFHYGQFVMNLLIGCPCSYLCFLSYASYMNIIKAFKPMIDSKK